MITVQLNRADFEYDIYSLVKAFFPAEDIVVGTEKKETKEGHIKIRKPHKRKEGNTND